MLSFGSNETAYRYSLLYYEGSMYGGEEPQPVAVAVTSDGSIYMMGVNPDNVEGTSDLGQSVLKHLPHVLVEQLQEARESGTEDVLGFLAASNQWNLYFSEPEIAESSEDIQTVGFRIFRDRIARFYHRRQADWSSPGRGSSLEDIFMFEESQSGGRARVAT